MKREQISSDKSGLRAKEVTLSMYEDLFRSIWDKSSRTLGVITMEALLRQAIARNRAEYGWLEQLGVNKQQGLVLTDLRERLEETDQVSLKAGFRAVILSLLGAMVDLTGKAMTEPLLGTLDEYLSESEQ